MFDQNIGKHCSVYTCRQKDWLPVKCKYCNQIFCADHCTIQSHSCPEYEKQYKKVFVCPLCNKTLKVNSNLTVEQNLSVHEAIECQGDYYANLTDVVICKGIKCRTKLTQLNTYTCSKCKKKVCLKHRMPQDHKCNS